MGIRHVHPRVRAGQQHRNPSLEGIPAEQDDSVKRGLAIGIYPVEQGEHLASLLGHIDYAAVHDRSGSHAADYRGVYRVAVIKALVRAP